MNVGCLSRLATVFVLITTLSAPAFPSRVPTVDARTFEPGRSWTWEYREATEFYSTERYTVVSNTGDQVVIEMSSRLKENEAFRPHHRISVSLSQCLSAYANPVEKKPWALKMFNLDHKGQWQEFDPGTTLAFEEKFNCNPHVYQNYGAPYRTVFKSTPVGPLFEHKRWGRLDGSRYFLDGASAGIAAEKRFAKPKGASYEFRFVPPTPQPFEFSVAAADGV